ncbi:hypothetical protein [Wolbachia endosymbiont (group A) of Bombylius major]|uniref:hypothetical protein n=1 Tax=Wolbachia endosymbiont (group A) of Bombylius major TaxID=2953988 RepID=UPI00222EE90E|nr:hypothetical protein [Wolbachia endosymbiont (group A) of Bombylius major]
MKLSLLDPSVSYSDDTILFPGSQCLGTGMTPFAVQFTFKNECSYSYGMNHGMT